MFACLYYNKTWLTLTPVSVVAVDSWEAPLSLTTHRARCPPGTKRPSPLLGRHTHAVCIKHTTLLFILSSSDVRCTVWQLTIVGEDCVEREVADVPLSADWGPWRLTWTVVLHHQRETLPGEVSAYMLVTHPHTHTGGGAETESHS